MGESCSIIVREIIPNIMGLLITNLTMAIPSAIFQEAFLSYIGLGISPPQASWGAFWQKRNPYDDGSAAYAVRAGILYLYNCTGAQPAWKRSAMHLIRD